MSDSKKNTSMFTKKYILIIFAVSVLSAVLIMPNLISTMRENTIRDITINEPDLTSIGDGYYPGSYSAGNYLANVGVTVYYGEIVKIEVQTSVGMDKNRTDALTLMILEGQTLIISDADYGKTAADKVFLKACEYALMGEATAV